MYYPENVGACRAHIGDKRKSVLNKHAESAQGIGAPRSYGEKQLDQNIVEGGWGVWLLGELLRPVSEEGKLKWKMKTSPYA